MSLETKLEQETKKWLSRIEKEIKNIKGIDEKGKEFLANINAYVTDCKYFLKKRDLIRASEAVVYAWGIYETCMDLKILKTK